MSKPKKTAASDLTFEAALARLEQVVRELESGERSLDEGLRLFQEGIGFTRLCEQRLDEAEAKVERLLDAQAAEPSIMPFTTGDDQ